MIRLILICLSLLFLLSLIYGQETPKLTKTYSVPPSDIPSVKTALEAAISSHGKIIPVEKSGKIVVQDISSQFEIIDPIISAFNAPQPNVRIEILSKNFGNQSRRNIDLQGRIELGGVSVGNRQKNGIDLGFENSSGTTDSLNVQFLVVRSGGSASIEVGKDLPFVDYFWAYARGLGLLTNITVRWEKIGSQLSIQPKVFGNQIQVQVIPQIRKLSNDFFEPEGVISFQTLQTTVTISDGETIDIGGIASADNEFQQRFFGFDRNQSFANSQITLKASILRD